MSSSRRLPPRQRAIGRIIEIDLGVNPPFDPAAWTLQVSGLVVAPRSFTWAEFLDLPQCEIVSDFHCVEGWSVFDQQWGGVRFRDLCEIVRPTAEARFVSIGCEDGYSTNMPLAAMRDDDVLLARTHNGADITPREGGPLRVVLSSRYAYKCAKFVRTIEFRAEDRPGYWEVRGYHNHADPWKEERHR
jgi:DMSO/TMAO reductase YedYZ molybdopterin-dependent catalytic subunit